MLVATVAGAAVPPALPAAAPFPKALHTRLEAALAARDPAIPPRTRHVDEQGGPLYTNRLLLESSPYLQQHAHNPVDWNPWGDAAFDKARELGRPVFLSIGYSTCHWCHVMEEESFDDVETARLLNAKFIAVKVDREARPDVDAVYMAALHASGERGGWPLNVFLTPDREPLYGGTYFPPNEGRGRPSFRRVLATIATQWSEQPLQMKQTAQSLAERVRDILGGGGALESRNFGPELAERAVLEQVERVDPEWGGIGRGMKFPSSFPLRLALRVERDLRDRAETSPDAAKRADAVRRSIVTTLDRMATGGIRDHVAGGFHRYSTERRWLIPHFEKMLYDNAQLARLYVEAWQWSGDDRYAEVARDTLAYLDREMSAPGGGFYSATDADSRGPSGEMEEGYYFSWTPAELRDALGEELAVLAAAWYGVSEPGNFEGRTILHTWRDEREVAAELGIEVEALRAGIEEARRRLRATRERRPPPLRDDKVVVAWNALAISAFARAGFALADEALVERASRAARFVLGSMRASPSGSSTESRLQRVHIDGRASVDAFLGDHVLLADALIDLYEADGNPLWLREAIELQAQVDARFSDAERGGYFRSAIDGEQLIASDKPRRDGAVPSGNAVAASVLLRLSELTGDAAYAERAMTLLAGFSAELDRRPSAFGEMLLSFELRSGTKEIVVVAPDLAGRDVLANMLAPLRRNLVTARVLATTFEGERQARTAEVVSLAERKPARDGRVTAYVCEKRVCQFPTTDPAEFARQLSIRPGR
ncbi:MAG: thioredoxin domain-containing protein [Myxococcota bacterium]|nr:thioredoxin domain-containing protein [Myxococcota bacterium]